MMVRARAGARVRARAGLDAIELLLQSGCPPRWVRARSPRRSHLGTFVQGRRRRPAACLVGVRVRVGVGVGVRVRVIGTSGALAYEKRKGATATWKAAATTKMTPYHALKW